MFLRYMRYKNNHHLKFGADNARHYPPSTPWTYKEFVHLWFDLRL